MSQIYGGETAVIRPVVQLESMPRRLLSELILPSGLGSCRLYFMEYSGASRSPGVPTHTGISKGPTKQKKHKTRMGKIVERVRFAVEARQKEAKATTIHEKATLDLALGVTLRFATYRSTIQAE